MTVFYSEIILIFKLLEQNFPLISLQNRTTIKLKNINHVSTNIIPLNGIIFCKHCVTLPLTSLIVFNVTNYVIESFIIGKYLFLSWNSLLIQVLF
jgi:hypothetical protein